jgi:hypothetical protein
MTRAFMCAAVAVAAIVAGPSAPRAQYGSYAPWCAQFRNATGVRQCTYPSYEICMETLSGIGGYCFQNPAGPPVVASRPAYGSSRVLRRHRPHR